MSLLYSTALRISKSVLAVSVLVGCVLVLLAGLTDRASAWTWSGGFTLRASLDDKDNQGNDSSDTPSISVDGRFVTFTSRADNLVPEDTNRKPDIFLKDLVTKSIQRVNTDSVGQQADDESYDSSVSEDGHFVVFASSADNLVPGDTNGTADVFLKDTVTGNVSLVSVDSAGVQANEKSDRIGSASISADGRFVTFISWADNLVPGDTNREPDIFVRDVFAGTTTRMNVDAMGKEANKFSFEPVISADGNRVAFCSIASNLVSGDTNGTSDCFVRSIDQASSIQRVSVKSGGGQSSRGSGSDIALSGDGRYVLFESSSDEFDPADTNTEQDLFRHDLQTKKTVLVSSDASGKVASHPIATGTYPSLSLDGQTAVFTSFADKLVGGINSRMGYQANVYVKHIPTQAITRLSSKPDGSKTSSGSYQGMLNNRAGLIAYASDSDQIIPGDTNLARDVFVAKPMIKRFPFPKP